MSNGLKEAGKVHLEVREEMSHSVGDNFDGDILEPINSWYNRMLLYEQPTSSKDTPILE